MDESILDGPRGRRLCLTLAQSLHDGVQHHAFWLAREKDTGSSALISFSDGQSADEPQPDPSIAGLVDSLGEVDPKRADTTVVLEALQDSVDSARYWQPADGSDLLTQLPDVRDALAPIASAIETRMDTAWWREGSRAAQWAIDWHDPDDLAPVGDDPADALARWADHTRAEEARNAKRRAADPNAVWSGEWWSFPPGVLRTTGELPDGTPVGLPFVEDSLGWQSATATPVRGDGRTCEIQGTDGWVALCRRHPLEVSASRRDDWRNATGRTGRWVIPDWQRVALEWDAVHLTTAAYLAAATKEIPVDDDTSSVIAGWGPDTTLWLRGVFGRDERADVPWRRDGAEWSIYR